MATIIITLPDGSKFKAKKGIKPIDIAKKLLGSAFAKKALVALVNGELWDLNRAIEEDAKIKILTYDDEEAIVVLRHSCAHVLAQAVKRLYPDVKLGIGPAIENGFFYDFDKKEAFTPSDLKRIEAEMKKIIKADYKFERKEISKEEAKKLFADEPYKLELIDEMEEPISVYKDGEFIDLCKGPHIPSTGMIKAFKLMKTAGAYWKGKAENPQLQRIYGVAFKDEKELKKYLSLLEEAEKRDHRKIGKELDLFSMHPEGPGFPFFHPKGMIVINEILKYWREEHEKEGYSEVKTPIILSKSLWEQSGHWEHYKENMYFTKIDGRDFAIKPMNCPGSILIYKERVHSYRELPLRWAELGLVHRHELSGVLSGLFRVRAFTQDDAHIYCMPEQIEKEVIKIIKLTERIYSAFGFKYEVELSTKPEKAMGTAKQWHEAETALKNALEKCGIKYKINPGEGAFYGPKIDFHVKDALGRKWQCGTIQLDFQMPERFDLSYEGKDGKRHRVVMLHRTVLGSLERFLGVLLEHFAGKLPLWIAPEQIRVITVSDKVKNYAEKVYKELKKHGFRVMLDDRAATVQYKIRDAQLQKIPYMVVIGEKEEKTKKIAVRTRENKVKFGVELDKFIGALKKEIKERKVELEAI
ncbi:threonine--tRNA ligase [Candidatus Woesearchaeota archaeon]|nr:threonine--tRNA ligase [Candidatus Woesearchaeota archaeon]RLE40619.1 MAG: threonine--tRNA ligase [Candidatus Woesearchaeota archaeon]